MYQVVVIGGGPAGVTAALRARELGATVALVERGRLGGTCTNDGCVPTRVLAKTARLIRDSEQFGKYGLRFDAPLQVDFAQIMQRLREVIVEVGDKKQLLDHLDEVGITVYANAGAAAFIDAQTIRTERGEEIRGERFLVCAGGHPRQLPIPGAEHILTSSSVWNLQTKPASLAIIGGGATGCQLASVFEDFGVKVTLLDIAPHLLLTEDADVSVEIERQFLRRNIQIKISIQEITRVEKRETDQLLVYTDADGKPQQLSVESVIASVGWPGNLDLLGLDKAGVKTERSYIVVDDYLRTTVPHIYAAGDITGRSMLVQSAEYQARLAVENALFPYTQQAQEHLVPHGGFTDPEYGGVGLTEAQAREHHDVITATIPYADLDRAVIDDRRDGFCKLIIDRRTNRILGAHVVGEHAVEIVSAVSAGMAGGLHVQHLASLEFAYPTFIAILGLAARQIAREVGAVQTKPEWITEKTPRAAEWERSNNQA
jgi:pyruvate/2-oxoglutarate dehydrogenase complex dihydrolipoamide dehydrogenase (E3) component